HLKMRISAIIFLMLLTSVGIVSQSTSHVCVQHLEPTIHYDRLARVARVQGVVSVHLTIGTDGRVTDAVATVVDQKYKAQEILIQRTVELVKNWTFSCLGCAIDSPYARGATRQHAAAYQRSEGSIPCARREFEWTPRSPAI